jgi:nicotinamide mononucleotide adenylyltransferase
MASIALTCVTGRFQPLHLQHLELLLEALATSERLIAAITNPDPGTREARPESAHRHLPESNPFTYHERLQLVGAALTEARVPAARFDIVPFPLHHPEVWPHYVPLRAEQLVRVHSPWEAAKARDLEAAGYAVRTLVGDPRTRISGVEVRRALREDGAWQALVPGAVVPLVERFVAERSLAARGA